ncbi:peptidylprolyl isomerase [Oculatella sp. LEGE 06141]|uniref:peptidylprolyl isomerase n=1 Tax=Oculatella sp. LEGE 06141 TaxID=1828648 RepID=UPI00187DE939|nr:peptidylprolyl isomerase [Oculatella sp. LEGE 06141]MBE9180001.1 peptidylprolyl isomerase [Oculatella sp. LEGE 06141]
MIATALQSNPSLIQDLHQRASNQELLPLLVNYQMMPQLLCERVIDRAIINIDCTPEEIETACQQLYQQWNLVTAEQQQTWRSQCGLSQVQFEAWATRSLRIDTFKQVTWGHKLESYFLERKNDVDQVIYSLLRTKDKDLAQELFFRIAEDEQSFAELAQHYSEGAEAQTGGLIGPVQLGTLTPALAERLRTSQVGQVEPFSFGGWCMIVRLEKTLPAQLDDAMRQQLLEEKFTAWLQEQLHQLPDRDKIWLGLVSPDADTDVKLLT